jgi:heme/copper-type cytochrome/quinol oxidase subunit 1
MLAVFGVSALVWRAIEIRGMPRRYASYVPEYDILFPLHTTEIIGCMAIVASAILAFIAIARKRHS